MKERLLPYFRERDATIDMLVLHCSAMTADKLFNVMDQYQLSCHYVIDLDGTLIKVVDESKSAQHAGTGFWRGEERSINSRSIGIEICNSSLGQQPYDPRQIEKLIPFCQKLQRKYNIPAVNIVGHSDVAPLRKADPGVAFPWKQLAREGLGLWYQLKNASKMNEEKVENLLAMIGYDTRNAAAVAASAYAFCRHFIPQYVQLVADSVYLTDHFLPDDYSFMAEEKFLQTLKAVAFAYK